MNPAGTRPAAKPFLALAPAFRDGRGYTARAARALPRSRSMAREATLQVFTAIDRAGARAPPMPSSQRWRDGKPLSPIDGMPIGVKDVIETRDMPTQMGSPLFAGHRTALRLRLRARAARGRRGDRRQDRDDRVRRDRARPDAQSVGSRAHAGRLVAAARRPASAAGYFCAALGTQVVGSILRPASYCGVFGMKPTVGAINRGGSMDHMSQSAQGVLAATLADGWPVRARSPTAPAAMPARRACIGPADACRSQECRRRSRSSRTPGWAEAEPRAPRPPSRTRSNGCARPASTIARSPQPRPRSRQPRARSRKRADAYAARSTPGSRAGRSIRSRPRRAEAQPDHARPPEGGRGDDARASIATISPARDGAGGLRAAGRRCDGVDHAVGAGEAPVGIRATGNPVFVVPGSLLGVPALSLPLLRATACRSACR